MAPARDEERQERLLPNIDEKLADCSLDQDLARKLMGFLSREEEARRLFRQELGYTFEDDEEEMESEVEMGERGGDRGWR